MLLLTTLAACSSSKKDDPKPDPAGISWTVDGGMVSTTTTQSQQSNGLISIAGTVANGGASSYLSLQIPNAVGTYTFGSSSLASATYSTTSGSNTTVYYAGPLPLSTGQTVIGSGTIVVTSLTATNVKGTFTFSGNNINSNTSKAITNGTFNVGL
ncbi:hypothetical protein GCM10027594_18090 [Hymenobacter agri]